jgi:hypothetical protein
MLGQDLDQRQLCDLLFGLDFAEDRRLIVGIERRL